MTRSGGKGGGGVVDEKWLKRGEGGGQLTRSGVKGGGGVVEKCCKGEAGGR